MLRVRVFAYSWPRYRHTESGNQLFCITQLALLLLVVAFGTECQNITNIDIREATAFNGSPLTNTSDGCPILIGQQLLGCTPGGSKLDDNITDGSLNNLERFFAFTRQSSTGANGSIEFLLNSFTDDISITIHYYNSASELIGFPSVFTKAGNTPIPFILSTSNDTTNPSIQSIVLQLIPSMAINLIRLNFIFPDACSIEWLLISEVQLSFEQNPVVPSVSPVSSQSVCLIASLPSVTTTVTSSSTVSSFNAVSQKSNDVSATNSQEGTASSPTATVTGSSLRSTTPSSSLLTLPPSPAGSDGGNIVPIAIGVVVGVVILIIAICVVLFLIIYCSRRKHKVINDLRSSTTKSSSQGMELTTNGASKNDEAKNELVYSVIVKKDKEKDNPPVIPPQNFDPKEAVDFDKGSSGDKKLELEWENSERPKLAKITNKANYKLVDNPVYDESAVYSSAGPYYSVAENIDPKSPAEAMYTEVPDKPPPVEAVYSTTEYFDLKNPIYDEADQYDDQPFSFISSDAYSDGPIYSEPVIASNKIHSVIEIDSSSFQEIKELGMGQFGEVVYAKTVGLSLKDLGLSSSDDNKDISVSVAIKKVKVDANEASVVSFKKEIKFMSQLHHQNVVQLLAVSQDGCEPFMVMEYMENGDLNQFLLWHEISHCHPPTEHDQLSPQNLLSMAIQIANGLTYLASHNYIHRDVATRNCLVGEDNIVKIADFGLSRHLYDSVYYRVKGKAKMPIRWMATECFYGKFSQFSDVWAYGVTVWEIYTMAREPPYSNLDDQQILDDALEKSGRMLLDKPASCPQEVYDCICSSCFVGNFRNRASFSTVHSRLLEVKQQLYG